MASGYLDTSPVLSREVWLEVRVLQPKEQGGPGEAEGVGVAGLMVRGQADTVYRAVLATHHFSGWDSAQIYVHRPGPGAHWQWGGHPGCGTGGPGRSFEGPFPPCWVWTQLRIRNCAQRPLSPEA